MNKHTSISLLPSHSRIIGTYTLNTHTDYFLTIFSAFCSIILFLVVCTNMITCSASFIGGFMHKKKIKCFTSIRIHISNESENQNFSSRSVYFDFSHFLLVTICLRWKISAHIFSFCSFDSFFVHSNHRWFVIGLLCILFGFQSCSSHTRFGIYAFFRVFWLVRCDAGGIFEIYVQLATHA